MEPFSGCSTRPSTGLSRASEAAPVPDPFDQYQGLKYLPELDGIRAFSVLMVVACHMGDKHVWEWLGGHQGVTIFFILSGYLITMLALREERSAGAVSLPAFYIRRTFRILPMYYLALTVMFILIHYLGWGQELRTTFDNALPSYLFYYQEFQFAKDLASNTVSPFAHSWSLGIEEKFYLVWPFLAFVVWRGEFRSRLTMALVLAALFASTKSLWRLGSPVDNWQLGRILSPYFEILSGAVLALLLDERRTFERLRFVARPVWTGALLLLFIGLHLLAARVGPAFVEIQILYTMAFTFLLGAIVLGRGRLTQMLQNRGLVFVGQLSYGIYLFHGLGISAAQKILRPGSGRIEISLLAYLVACAVTIGVCYVLAIVLERPLVRVGKRLSARWPGEPTARMPDSPSIAPAIPAPANASA